MPETIRGTIQKAFHSSPSFSAGLLKTDEGKCVRFAGKLCANVGDVVALVGRWKHDAKYGRQFTVEGLSYELPDSADGLAQYLAKHPAFAGIGDVTARRIVAYTCSAANLDRIIRHDVEELHRQLRIPRATLSSLREAWIANSAENEIRAYLAGFGLTDHQIQVLLESVGNSIVGILRSDPYQLIRYVDGFGFKRIDRIARAMGTPKDHPGRIAAGLQYVVREEFGGGHTWIAGADLIDKANELLLLDTLDSRDIIRRSGEALLAEGTLVADGSAVTTPTFLEAETLIQRTLSVHACRRRPVPAATYSDQLNAGQLDALRTALTFVIALISGPAGSGKTFVLARIARAFLDAGLSIALCAPTGKAAKRIEETLRAAGLNLEAKTIHRLLRYDGHRFRRESLSCPSGDENGDEDEDGGRGYGVVLVDESSMCDAPLVAELLRRIDFERTRLVLVGDHNQLPPVGPGNVLRDLIAHRLVPTVILRTVERQAGILKANSALMLTGVVAPTATSDPGWTVTDAFQDALPIQAYLRDLVLKTLPARLGLDPVRDIQIITPTHLGALGTKAINQMMQHALHGSPERKFAVGDKVIQTANDYDLGVMNGTTGYVLAYDPGSDGGYWIEFDGAGQRCIRNEQLQRVQLAYVLTAHKCVAGDTLIPTRHGLICIAELAAGIPAGAVVPRTVGLSTLHGAAASATLHCGGTKLVRRVRTRAGYEVAVTQEHPLLVASDTGMAWKRAAGLRHGEVLVLRRGTWVEQSDEPLREVAWEGRRLAIDAEVGWLLGVLVGDGSYTDEVDGRVEVTKADAGLMLRYMAGVQRAFGARTSIRAVRDTGRYSVYFHGRALRAVLAELGLGYNRAPEKRIPNVVLRSPPAVQAAFLRGLFDTDGSARRTVVLTTTSARLAHEVHVMLLHHGIIARRYRLRPAMPERGWSEVWRVDISGIGALRQFRHRIGSSHEKKAVALAVTCASGGECEFKSNWGAIPFGAGLARELRQSLRARGGRNYPQARRLGRLLSRVICSTSPLNHGHVDFLAACIPDLAEQGPSGRLLAHISSAGLFFDPIVSIEDGTSQVYDMLVPSSHSYVSNGIISHNCQGSEFPCAVVLCHRSHFFADRNWLYTAVTRAAKYCVLVGDRCGLRNAARKNTVICRRTFLDRWAQQRATEESPTGELAHV